MTNENYPTDQPTKKQFIEFKDPYNGSSIWINVSVILAVRAAPLQGETAIQTLSGWQAVKGDLADIVRQINQ